MQELLVGMAEHVVEDCSHTAADSLAAAGGRFAGEGVGGFPEDEGAQNQPIFSPVSSKNTDSVKAEYNSYINWRKLAGSFISRNSKYISLFGIRDQKKKSQRNRHVILSGILSPSNRNFSKSKRPRTKDQVECWRCLKIIEIHKYI